MSRANIIWEKGPEFPWTSLFIELALRALTDLHHRYLLYSYNQPNIKQPDFSKLNNGLGIAYADEISVCAAITQEFMSSPFKSGVEFKEIPEINVNAGEHSWEIKLNPRYSDMGGKPNGQRADFYVKRTGKGGEGTIPSMIEAKRAYLHYPGSKPVSQIGEIESDIEKLRLRCKRKLRGHILVWNIATNNEEGPHQYFKKLKVGKPDIHMQGIRQIPLHVSKSYKPLNMAKIEKSLWVALGEVTERYKDDPLPRGY